MTRRWALCVSLGATLLAGIVGGCSEEDGGPYPPLQVLVQCHADAAPDDPEACPDLGLSAVGDMGVVVDEGVSD